jgi:hypothetical protein
VGASLQREEQEDRRQPWSLSQWGQACWQTSEPQDKNHRVNFVHSAGLQSPKHKLVLLLFYIHNACVVALVTRLLV